MNWNFPVKYFLKGRYTPMSVNEKNLYDAIGRYATKGGKEEKLYHAIVNLVEEIFPYLKKNQKFAKWCNSIFVESFEEEGEDFSYFSFIIEDFLSGGEYSEFTYLFKDIIQECIDAGYFNPFDTEDDHTEEQIAEEEKRQYFFYM